LVIGREVRNKKRSAWKRRGVIFQKAEEGKRQGRDKTQQVYRSNEPKPKIAQNNSNWVTTFCWAKDLQRTEGRSPGRKVLKGDTKRIGGKKRANS